MQSHFSSDSLPSSAQSLEAEFAKVIHKQRGIERLKQWAKRTANLLLDFLTGQSAISICSECLESGKLQWIVYDPTTENRHVFDSQQAVRTWLEQRYYR